MDSSMGKMTKKLSLAMVVMAALVLALGMPGQASAATCAAVGGTDVGGNCTISTAITAFCPFNLTVPGDLLITSTGSIDCGDPVAPPGAGALPITISVGGDMEMQAGSSILAENSLDGGNGGNITITVGGDFTMRGPGGVNAGAVISSSKTSPGNSVAGNIRITVGNVTVNPDDLTITCATTPAGDILEETGARILANNADGVAGNIKMFAGKNATINGDVLAVALLGAGKGGQITIDACCDLVVGDTGQVVSRGRDPGADLVHLQGCVVQILGLVASTGPAHEPPFANVCNVNRPGKPADSGACVEIWAGTTLLIDSTGTHKGEVNADIGTSGGTQGFAWIDILANGAITIRGNATAPVLPLVNNNDTTPAYAVHANMFLQNGHGGDITAISKDSTVTMFGRAIQANASTTSNGGQGGHIDIQGNLDVAFGTGVTPAFVQAAGDITGGGSQAGGTVNAKSFNGNVTGIATSQISVLGPGGTATLEACLANPSGTYLGTVIGAEVDNFPFCGGSPTFPVPANTLLPAATCATSCQPPPPGNKSGVKFNDLNQNGVQDGAEPGLIGWTIHLFNTGTMALLQTKVTLAANPGPPTPDGFYAFDPLPPGNYTVCEALQAGWTQTAPLAVPPPAGETLANCAPFGVANGLTLGPRGYSFTITAAAEVFAANNFGNFLPPGDCPEDPLRASKITRVVDQTGTSHGPAPVYFTVQDAYNAAGLTGEVIGLFSQTTENVVLNDAKSLTITQCRNARVTAADSTLPVWTISSTKSLLIIGPDAVGGTVGWLFQTGNHEAKGLRASGASQFGIQVMSNNNSVAWNSANNNAVGVGVSGSFNSLRGGTVQGNTSDGVQISGNSNTLQGATVQSNLGVGINVSGTSNTLKNDKSNTTGQGGTKENGGAEYCFANNTTQDLGSNKKDNANFVGQIAGSPKRYATGCYE